MFFTRSPLSLKKAQGPCSLLIVKAQWVTTSCPHSTTSCLTAVRGCCSLRQRGIFPGDHALSVPDVSALPSAIHPKHTATSGHMPLSSASPCSPQSVGAQSDPWRPTPGSSACPHCCACCRPDSSAELCVLQSVRARYQLPLGAVIHPLADPQDVPVVNLGSAGIVRCRMCRTLHQPLRAVD